jgi:hypothetical protein
MNTYVPRERIELDIGGFTGTPQELTLELTLPDETVRLVVLGQDPAFTGDAVNGYKYQFVATDAQCGIWLYRFFGRDALGVEFARPTDHIRESISIG